MKKTACNEMGGPATCTAVFEENSAEDTVTKAWEHLQKEHPDMAANIMKNPPEENAKWMEGFKKEWEAKPEM